MRAPAYMVLALSGRQYAADDAETISRRIKELDAERLAVYRCQCPRDAYGFVHSHARECPLHPLAGAQAYAEAHAGDWALGYR